MEVGVEVWIRDTHGDQSWIPGIVQMKKVEVDNRLCIVVRNDYGETFNYSFQDENQDHDEIKLRNDSSESEVEDLINLPYLHEPAILYCLEQRYEKSDIYTYTGPILIAMNPFKKVQLYTNQILEVYYNSGLLKSQGIESTTNLPPHVYAIADSAYRDMMMVIMQGYNLGGNANSSSAKRKSISGLSTADHSILISGESGAGKTESTKIVLRYLTTVGNPSGGLDTINGSVMDKVLQSNPILEAFGNARTLRNDNSSRFGKFIELNFNKRGHLIGGTIRTYLLEKVRLPFQQLNERNFHIFYQIVAGANDAERNRWSLTSIEDYDFAAQGGIYKLQGIDDEECFEELKTALHTLNFIPDDQMSLLDVTAAMLHLGQITFMPDGDGEGSQLSPEVSLLSDGSEQSSMTSLEVASRLLGILPEQFIHAMTVRTIVARTESYEKKLTDNQASDARDAIAKAIYGKLFDWLVYTINRSIEVDRTQIRANIGVLDIFGFECFANNSFEQLCINFTNETLQQQFNQYIFKMEQIEYQSEQIEWSFISFPDNQDCLDLIEYKQNGILAMIDDECKLPKATDEKLAARLHKALEGHPRFSANAVQKRDHKFCIKHYAGSVVYSTISFVDKNRDELPKEASTLLQSSKLPLLSKLFSSSEQFISNQNKKSVQTKSTTSSSSHAPSANQNQNQSVGNQFKEQLHTLMETIYATTPHYIRCLKPNDMNVPDNFNRIRITEQLRYGGVLEAVRVARSGFPVRLSHLDFYARYRPLANPFNAITAQLPAFLQQKMSGKSVSTSDRSKSSVPSVDNSKVPVKQYCELLMQALWDDSISQANVNDSSQAASQAQSIKRGIKRRQSKIEEINIWKGKSAIAKESIQLGLTKVFMRKPAHDLLEGRRSRRIVSAARRLQCNVRCYQTRKWYTAIRSSILLLQRVSRGMFARIKARNIREYKAGVIIQRNYLSYIARKRYTLYRNAIIVMQNKFRSLCAKRNLHSLRCEKYCVRLQSIVRGLLIMHRYRRFRYATIILQNRMRKKLALKTLKELRIAARDVGKLRQSNEALKAEIELLRHKALEERQRIQVELEKQMLSKAQNAKVEELENLRLELDNCMRALEIEKELHHQTQGSLQVLDNELKATMEQLNVAEAKIKSLDRVNQSLNQTIQQLQLQLQGINLDSDRKSSGVNLQLKESPVVSNAVFDNSTSKEDLRAMQQAYDNLLKQREKEQVETRRMAEELRKIRETSEAAVVPSEKDYLTSSKYIQDESYLSLMKKYEIERKSREMFEREVQRLQDLSIELQYQHTNITTDEANKSIVSEMKSIQQGTVSKIFPAIDPGEHQILANIQLRNEIEYQRSYNKPRESLLHTEKSSKEQVEAEVFRLRSIILELQAQNEQLKKGTEISVLPLNLIDISSEDTGRISTSSRNSSENRRRRSLPMKKEDEKLSIVSPAEPRVLSRRTSVSSVNSNKRMSLTNTKSNKALQKALASGDFNGAVTWSTAWDNEDNETNDDSASEKSGSVTDRAITSPAAANISHLSSSQLKSAVANTTLPQNSFSIKVIDRNAKSNATVGELNSAVVSFEKNLETFRAKLRQGIQAALWEGQKISNVEIILKLEAGNKLLLFESPNQNKRFLLFQSRIDVAPLSISDIIECIPGAEIKSSNSNDPVSGETQQSMLLTIVTKDDGKGSRIMALRLATKDLRNNILTGLRTLIADVHMTSPTNKLLSSLAASSTINAQSSKSLVGTHHSVVAMNNPQTKQPTDSFGNHFGPTVTSPIVQTGTNPMLKASRDGKKSPASSKGVSTASSLEDEFRREATSTATPADAALVATGTNHQHRSTRRKTLRDSVIEETLSQSLKSKLSASIEEKSFDYNPATMSKEELAVAEELKKQLQIEKSKYERMMMQVLIMTNDLNEREDQINTLKKKEEYYEQTLLDRDNMYKQDAMVRMQLGKRLEQVLMDKEEALEQIQLMKDQVESLKSAFDSVTTK